MSRDTKIEREIVTFAKSQNVVKFMTPRAIEAYFPFTMHMYRYMRFYFWFPVTRINVQGVI